MGIKYDVEFNKHIHTLLVYKNGYMYLDVNNL